ncbi:MAG: PAS domain S-box protein [Desulfobacterales bacterium]|nr:PAS domain S-box protein [Desulfobacterales bacterium]
MSPFEVSLGLLKNLVAGTLSITFIGLVRAAFWKRNRIIPGWLLGILFAGAAFIGMLFPVIYSAGVLRDFRNSLIALASFYGGLPAGMVAAGIAGTFRLYLGGGGAFGGIMGLFCSALIGAIFYKNPVFKKQKLFIWRLPLLGISVFIITFIWSWTLPKEQVWRAVQIFFFPELIAYPLVTSLFGILYHLETDRQTSMERFRAVFSQSPLGILIVTTSEYRIIDANPAFCGMLGFSRSELLNRSLSDIVHPEHIAEVGKFIQDNHLVPKEFKAERKFKKKSGETVWLNVAATEIKDQDGQVRYGIGVLEDITDRKAAEVSLQQYLRRLKILHKTDQAILKAQSTERIIQEALNYTLEMIPCQRASVILFDFQSGRANVMVAEISGESQIKRGTIIPLEDFLEIDKLKKGDCILIQDLSAVASPSVIFDTLRKEGMRSYLMIPLSVQEDLIGTLNLGASNLSAFDAQKVEIAIEAANSLAVAIQNTRLVEEIVRHQNELKKMSARIMEAQEIERKRISIELHDEMGQALTAISINLAVVEKMISDHKDTALVDRLIETRKMADQASDQIRDLSYNLRPSILDDLGLEPALRWYIGQFAKRLNIKIAFEASNCGAVLNPEVKTHIYRIAQETLNNVAKHADARKIHIRLTCDDETVRLFIQDDGKGVEIDHQVMGKGLGLLGIRERVAMMKGEFKIESALGQGTKLTVEMPIRLGEKQ